LYDSSDNKCWVLYEYGIKQSTYKHTVDWRTLKKQTLVILFDESPIN